MKKTMMLLLCLLIVVSLFATTALAAAITPRGSEGAAWTNKTIRQTSAIIAEGEKSDTGKADVYITKTDYPYNTTVPTCIQQIPTVWQGIALSILLNAILILLVLLVNERKNTGRILPNSLKEKLQ